MLALFLAAQVVAPDPGNVGTWFTNKDVPRSVWTRHTGVWRIPVRVDVAPSGKIADCRAEVEGRIPELDAHTCKIIRRRAKFRPAQFDGRPTHGIYRTAIFYAVSNTATMPASRRKADVRIVVDRLPAHIRQPTLVKVAFAVDRTGQKSLCTMDNTVNLEIIQNDPVLVPLACKKVLASYTAVPASVAGIPTVSVQTAVVEFFVKRSR